ncbi:hypothetical protein PINS_up004018 [Pythium insidiosum]|nr:hypothetical protein PINS_up004018 [Pythium insidiosum]
MSDSAKEQLAKDTRALRDAIEHIQSEELKVHMRHALDDFERSRQQALATSASTHASQSSDDSNDTIVVALRTKDVTTQAPRDALFLAVHAILLETGFQVDGAERTDVFPLPADWDANSATGLFTGTYKHQNDTTVTFTLQGLFVRTKFELYLSDDQNHTHSIELSADNYVALSAETSSAGDLLRDLATLRQKLTPFFENIAPKRKSTPTSREVGSTQPGHPPFGGAQGYQPPSGAFPSVGSGDILPPGLGGGDPSSEVGPNHPLFGQRYDPTRGPVPGARFDPYGPLSVDPQGPPRGFIGGPHPMRPGPAPGFAFGEPNPDHLRMPGDDDMGDPFSQDPRRRGPGLRGPPVLGGFRSDFPPPYFPDRSSHF